MTSAGQTFTVTEAAGACRVSRKTITRRFDQLRDAGASKDAAGAWTIPLAALLSVGLTPGKPAPPDAVSVPVSVPHIDQIAHSAQLRITEMEEQVVDLRRRTEVAEALAGERAERITDLHRALAVLEAAPQHRAVAVDQAVEPPCPSRCRRQVGEGS